MTAKQYNVLKAMPRGTWVTPEDYGQDKALKGSRGVMEELWQLGMVDKRVPITSVLNKSAFRKPYWA